MTDKEKLNAIRAEIKEYIDAARKAHTNITEGNFAHLLSFIDSLQEEPVSENLEEEFKQVWEKYGVKEKEEPVSEDFEEALANEWKGYNDRGAATVDALEDNTQELAFAKGFYRGANWQKQQFEKDYTDLCKGIATAKGLAVTMAYDKGMADARKQMMANAVDGYVIEDIEEGNGDFLLSAEYLPKSMGLKDGQKVKVIVVKQ